MLVLPPAHPSEIDAVPALSGELVLKSEVVAETASATPAEEPASEPETIAEDPVEKWKRDHPPAAEAAEGL